MNSRIQAARQQIGLVLMVGPTFLAALFVVGGLVFGYADINAFLVVATLGLAFCVAGMFVVNWKVAAVTLPVLAVLAILAIVTPGPLATWLLGMGVSF